MFNKIQNPETGNWVNINGNTGKKILANYMNMSGGSMKIKGKPVILNPISERPCAKIKSRIKCVNSSNKCEWSKKYHRCIDELPNKPHLTNSTPCINPLQDELPMLNSWDLIPTPRTAANIKRNLQEREARDRGKSRIVTKITNPVLAGYEPICRLSRRESASARAELPKDRFDFGDKDQDRYRKSWTQEELVQLRKPVTNRHLSCSNKKTDNNIRLIKMANQNREYYRKNNPCFICKDEFDDIYQMEGFKDCKHYFHRDCLKNNLRGYASRYGYRNLKKDDIRPKKCPLCTVGTVREELTDEVISECKPCYKLENKSKSNSPKKSKF